MAVVSYIGEKCRQALQYCKPLVQTDSTFMYKRYTHWLLLAVAQDDNRKILLINFAITLRESAYD
ncbi:hypothetical protein J1N35_022064 [Gossypium stocksii]|uniref:Uncharacterized protein n=1 Tax=Gossypium stocksii TaxID=47602 RepID=A0A9D3VFW9_9ROSI|nr:hypothetical protein J1N35_022064 [Gossypium stocksii]